MSELELPGLYDKIRELETLHRFCAMYQHGVARLPRRLYEPQAGYVEHEASSFVYAFFTFNAFYSVDWEASLQQLREEPVDATGSEQERFWRMATFCYDNNPEAPKVYSRALRHYCKLFGVDSPEREIDRLSPTPNKRLETKLYNQYVHRQTQGNEINIQSIEGFKAAFRTVNARPSGPRGARLEDHRIAVNGVLYFVYLVRNNIFHGRKDITDMGPNRKQRLLVYAAILMAANDLLLKTVQPALRESDSNLKLD